MRHAVRSDLFHALRTSSLKLVLWSVLLLPFAAHAADYLYIGGDPAPKVNAPGNYSFQPWLSVPASSRSKVVFSIKNRPGWASFNTANGTLSGAVSAKVVGAYSNITIYASDGLTKTQMQTFSITVTGTSGGDTTPPTTSPPKISGSPATSATVGTAYSFVPAASDSNGYKLTFSIKNAPAWAVFDATTGRLSGTPATTAVGTTSNILISASDGKASASLPAFSITVNNKATTPPATAGVVQMSWIPPTRNTDGSALSNLAGYIVSYGTSASILSTSVTIPNPGTSSFQISNLKEGTVYYFVIRAYTNSGVQSALSGIVSASIK